MLKRSLTKLTIFTLFSLSPIAAIATCGDYPLTQAQQDLLEAEALPVKIPVGETPVIIRCDVDGNKVINNDDLVLIRAHRGEKAAHPDDPMDWDGNGIIHGRDVGGCASSCSSKGCAVKELDEEQGLVAAQQLGDTIIEGDSASCFQTGDFDGDGSTDFVGIFEHTGDDRGGNWTLSVSVMHEDDNGVIQHINYPYSGQQSSDKTQLNQHLSMQLAGVVDLMPGTLTLDKPAVVSYRDGEPAVIYYFKNGKMNRAFYGVDD